jgi:hypothetical protein
MNDRDRLQTARQLMDEFAERTGLTGTGGNKAQRYLWTDAFAVQTFFGLARAMGVVAYREQALKLIDEVHGHLGRFHPTDKRKGWISGLPEEEGRQHPTAGGLRIGKALSERGPNDPFDEELEWQRDGQYFHYLTRWMTALLGSSRETGDQRYAGWAAECLQATGKFIYRSGSRVRMYWKMSTDLSRALVSSMGAHDPLDGLVCAESTLEQVPAKRSALQPLLRDLEACARGLDWATSDALGIGGLLLNLVRVIELDHKGVKLPDSIRPEKLLADSILGLEAYRRAHHPDRDAERRLAFRECGLSLGLRAVTSIKESPSQSLNLRQLDRFIPLADDIEAFWTNPRHQASPTWTEHLDINAVTLAASLVGESLSH